MGKVKRKVYLMRLVGVLGLLQEHLKISPHGYCHKALENRVRNIAFTGSDDILILNTD